MLQRIRDVEQGNVAAFVEPVKKREQGARLMGFGHRVSQELRPARAKIVKQSADEVLNKLGVTDPLLDIAKTLEERALTDDDFVGAQALPERRLLQAA
jgi:citrate synthase